MDKIELETIEFVNVGEPNFDTKKQPMNAENLKNIQTNTNNALSQIQDKMAFFTESTTLNDLVIKSNLLGNNSKINASEIAVVNNEEVETLDKCLDKVIINHTFADSTSNSISFDVDIKPNEKLEIEIFGGATIKSDVELRINEIQTGYYQSGFYFQGSNTTSDADLSSACPRWRPNKSAFYLSHCLSTDFSMIQGELSLRKITNSEIYKPFYKWSDFFGLAGDQGIGFVSGWLDDNIQNITKLTFTLTNSSSYFKAGTTIKIIKKALG